MFFTGVFVAVVLFVQNITSPSPSSDKMPSPLRQQEMYRLSICAIFKDEAPYLKEWIEFHKLQGVEHFFLYNNNSSDDYLNVLQSYILSNEVTVIEWPYTYQPVNEGNALPWIAIQTGAYTDCIKKYGDKTCWLAVIDIDEFLFCLTGQALPDFLQNYKKYGGVGVNWLYFGTSYVESLPEGSLMIEHLTRCAPKDDLSHSLVKSIVQPKYVESSRTAHTFNYKKGFFAVDVDGNRLSGLLNELLMGKPSYDRLRIHHYWTRTESYFSRCKIASRNARRTYDDETVLRQRSMILNLDLDETILQFVPALKEKMGLDSL